MFNYLVYIAFILDLTLSVDNLAIIKSDQIWAGID